MKMRIGGFQKVSLIDYPGKVVAVVFVVGCNFRCPYCHNRDLVLSSEGSPTIPEEEILTYLKKREGLVDGVVITGGEPTLQKELFDFVRKIKDLGLLVKLDTNGANPTALHSAVANNLFDYVALDVKGPLDHRYANSIGLENFDNSLTLCSIRELVNSKIDFELRTTVVPGQHSEEDLLDLAKQLKGILTPHFKPPTSPPWFLQNFQPKNCLDPEFEKIKPYDSIFFEGILEKLKVYMPNVELRR